MPVSNLLLNNIFEQDESVILAASRAVSSAFWGNAGCAPKMGLRCGLCPPFWRLLPMIVSGREIAGGHPRPAQMQAMPRCRIAWPFLRGLVVALVGGP